MSPHGCIGSVYDVSAAVLVELLQIKKCICQGWKKVELSEAFMGTCASTSMQSPPTPLPPSSLASTRVAQISAEYAALRADSAASCAPSFSADASHERVMKGKNTARLLHSYSTHHVRIHTSRRRAPAARFFPPCRNLRQRKKRTQLVKAS
jgi:hypothetical protein